MEREREIHIYIYTYTYIYIYIYIYTYTYTYTCIYICIQTHPHPPIPAAGLISVSQRVSRFSSMWGSPEVETGDNFFGFIGHALPHVQPRGCLPLPEARTHANKHSVNVTKTNTL